jgi:hypothetical protein
LQLIMKSAQQLVLVNSCLTRNDAMVELCSAEFNVAYFHNLEWKLPTPPPKPENLQLSRYILNSRLSKKNLYWWMSRYLSSYVETKRLLKITELSFLIINTNTIILSSIVCALLYFFLKMKM